MLRRLRRRSDPAVLAEQRAEAIKAADRAARRVHRYRQEGRRDPKAERELLNASRDFLRTETARYRATGEMPLALTH